jgi:hypothetical protein
MFFSKPVYRSPKVIDFHGHWPPPQGLAASPPKLGDAINTIGWSDIILTIRE